MNLCYLCERPLSGELERRDRQHQLLKSTANYSGAKRKPIDAKISRQSAVEDISLLAVEENPILIFPVDPGQMQHELHHVPIYSGWFRQ